MRSEFLLLKTIKNSLITMLFCGDYLNFDLKSIRLMLQTSNFGLKQVEMNRNSWFFNNNLSYLRSVARKCIKHAVYMNQTISNQFFVRRFTLSIIQPIIFRNQHCFAVAVLLNIFSTSFPDIILKLYLIIFSIFHFTCGKLLNTYKATLSFRM